MAFLEELSSLKAHNLAYRGESLASFNMMVFDCFCEVKPRPGVSAGLRHKIVQNQRHLCALCGDMLTDDLIIDHIVPRAALGSDNIDNLHAICSPCDKLKTFDDKGEIQIEEKNPFLSRFNKDTFEIFCLSRKPTQVVCNLHSHVEDLPVLEVDVISCRLNRIYKLI